VQAKNGVLTANDRQNLNREYTELANEVGRLTEGATYNTVSIFTDANKSLSLQVGAGNSNFDSLLVNLTTNGTSTGDALQTVLGASNPGTIQTDIAANFGDVLTVGSVGTGGAADALSKLDDSIDSITTIRATLGANLSRLEQVIASLDTSSTNLATARGRIMDADYARETASLTRTQILQQAGTAMLTQANQIPNQVLSLLRQ
jgi:flagellin